MLEVHAGRAGWEGGKKKQEVKRLSTEPDRSLRFQQRKTDNKPEWRDVLAFTTTRAVKTMPALVLLPELHPQL